ncbi:MAG: DUF2922 domain-containing protein [Desulfotomaculaceae bacterium]
MATYLEMVFRNQAGYLVIISVLDPRPDITPGEVEAVMDTIITQNIFTSPGGDLVAKVEARVIERTYTWYNVS